MRKALAAALICLCFFLGCEIPQSVEVKGEPGFYLFLGSPFQEDNPVKENLNIEEFKKKMGESFEGAIASYTSSSIKLNETTTIDGGKDIQTFMIHYKAMPSMEMETATDLNENVPGGFVLPLSVLSGLPSGVPAGEPLPQNIEEDFSIPLDSLSGFVAEVLINDGDMTTLTLENGEALSEALYIKSDALGIPNFTLGVKDGDDLVFRATEKRTLYPRQGDIQVEYEIRETVSTSFEEDLPIILDLKWQEAKIRPQDAAYKDTFELPAMSDLQDFLGGLKFKEIPVWLYISGLDNAMVKLYKTKNGVSTSLAGYEDPRKASQSVYSEPASEGASLPEPSLSFSLNELFKSGDDTELGYEITIDEMTITPETSEGVTFGIDLVIILPFWFTVPYDPDQGESQVITVGNERFLKLDMSIMPDLTEGDESEDFFGRDPDDGAFISLEDDGKVGLRTAVISLRNIKNNVSNDLYFGLETKRTQVISFNPNDVNKFDDLSFTQEDMDYPFNPEFSVMVKQTGGATSDGELKFMPMGENVEFDLELAAGVEAEFTYTLEL